VRLFVAVNFPADLRRRIHDDTRALRDAAPDVSWTAPDNLHLTLRFLGDVDEHGVSRLTSALPQAVVGQRAFVLRMAGAGAFPNFARPRVVWIGVTDPRPLSALAEDVEQACALLGFERDARAFAGHVTLGRVRRPLSREAARALESAARGVPNDYVTTVQSAELMQSELSPRGSRYTVVASLPLAGS
jgi:2'-5' RNA ligase